MRHRRRTLLALRERLLGLLHFGALQMTNLDGELFQGAGDDRQGGKVIGMTVALDDLIGNRAPV